MIKKSIWALSAGIVTIFVSATATQAETNPDDPFTGLYIGVHGGLSRGSFDIGARTVTRPSETVPGEAMGDPPIVIPASSETIDALSPNTGIKPIGGGQIGFNVASRTVLFGIEADVSYSSADATDTQLLTEEVGAAAGIPPRLLSSDLNINAELSASARVRAGIRQQDLVYYVTGGIAAARIDVTSTGSTSVLNGEAGVRTVTASDEATHTGYTAGLGVLGWFGGGAIGGLELRYSDYGSKTYDIAGTSDTPIVPTEIGLSNLQLLIRMSYRF